MAREARMEEAVERQHQRLDKRAPTARIHSHQQETVPPIPSPCEAHLQVVKPEREQGTSRERGLALQRTKRWTSEPHCLATPADPDMRETARKQAAAAPGVKKTVVLAGTTIATQALRGEHPSSAPKRHQWRAPTPRWVPPQHHPRAVRARYVRHAFSFMWSPP